ncbi:MAG TPA: hypothetical protein VKB79_23245 [Bryobacteraceae bacterium]|nr:hypothetical protein [Bryobacteraceae bacterium]
MIRIEGIPIVAARLAALESAKVSETARQVRPSQTPPSPKSSTTVRPSRPPKNARVAA